MKRKELEIKLQAVPKIVDPSPELEQYNTPSYIAADILYTAFMDENVVDKKVADLGTGSGILAIGASILGSKEVYAIDCDENMIKQAKANAKTMGIENIRFITAEIQEDEGMVGIEESSAGRITGLTVDTVIMNPPYGAQKPHADIPFLETALRIAKTTYTIHQTRTMDHVKKKIKAFGGSIEGTWRADFPIPYTFKFHEHELKHIDVTIMKIVKNR